MVYFALIYAMLHFIGTSNNGKNSVVVREIFTDYNLDHNDLCSRDIKVQQKTTLKKPLSLKIFTVFTISHIAVSRQYVSNILRFISNLYFLTC